jgi:uncharacterized integral membrane protein
MTKKVVKKKTSKKKPSSAKPLNKRQKLKASIKKHTKKIKKSTIAEKIKKIKTEHKVWFVAIIAVILILIIIFGARIYLFFNFLLGSDTLV